ncbi:MAG: Ger(x)C family spore germination protein, partial [Clostridia bacterium]|nr:Ger(x)C family spore germination protein [Clostridia bacterium]
MKRMGPGSKLLILMSICLLLLSGCWSRRELNFLAIVEGFGVDKDRSTGEVVASHQIIKPDVAKAGQGASEGGGSSGSPVWNLTARGKTFFDAIRKGSLQSPRRLYYGHNKIIVIGEEAAKGGISPYLDLAGRDPELRPGVWVFIARGTTAEEIINAQSVQNPISSTVIDDMAKVSRASSYSAPIAIEDFLRILNSEPTAVYAPGIIIGERIKKDGQELVGFRLSGTAVFIDDKLIGWLDEEETRGLLWLLG